jgi:nanoRNase/pAp phosphatase (c-di-AMP/oligoRNAs hydrolase)
MLYPRFWLRLKEFKVLAISIKNSRFRNDIGHCLATESKEQGGIPCGAVAYLDKKQGKIKISLRSLEEYDITSIAAEYGGGGHSHAGSFSVDEQTFNFLKIKQRVGRRR